MSALNTLAGKIIKDYSIAYKEKLHNELWFYIVQRYSTKTDNKNYFRQSSEMYIDAIITDGSLISYSNNVVAYREVTTYEEILKSENFKDIDTQIYYTKDGFKYYNEIYHETEYSVEKEKNNKTYLEKRKSRKSIWVVEVDKENLLRKCLTKK